MTLLYVSTFHLVGFTVNSLYVWTFHLLKVLCDLGRNRLCISFTTIAYSFEVYIISGTGLK